jgi:hypothetical protein
LLLPIENGGKNLKTFGKGTELMRKLIKITFTVIAFGFLASSADNALAQGRNKEARKEYKREVREARREYRDDIRNGDRRREARREYRNEVRDARREYREDRRDNRSYNRTYNRPPYGRANGYYNVRPYRGARRGFYRGRLPQNRYYVPRNRRWR